MRVVLLVSFLIVNQGALIVVIAKSEESSPHGCLLNRAYSTGTMFILARRVPPQLDGERL